MSSTPELATRLLGVCRLLRRHRTRLVVSTVGVLMATLAVPKMLPVWLANSVGWTTGGHQLLSMNADERLLSGLVLAGGYLRDAIETAEREQQEIRAEQDAFETFAQEVESMSARSGQPSTPCAVPADLTSPTEQLQTVRTRYRETVMATDDFEDAYDETLAEHLTAEFGPDLAAVLTGGGQLTAPVKQLLLQQAHGAVTQRERLLEEIEAERQSLKRIGPKLDPVDCTLERTTTGALRQEPFDQLIEREHELRTRRQTCEQLLARRQQDIHENRPAARTENILVQEYLYSAMDVTFPALASILDRIERLDDHRQNVARAIARQY